MAFEARWRSLVPQYLGRPWRAHDGISPAAVASAEQRLHCLLPAAVRAFYCTLGAIDALCTVHNRIRSLEKLAFEEDYLLFMDENQDVVSWGVRRRDIDQPNPPTWQRNNTPPTEWFAEEKSFTELLESMFEWYASSTGRIEELPSPHPASRRG
jgi:hypothetical protein